VQLTGAPARAGQNDASAPAASSKEPPPGLRGDARAERTPRAPALRRRPDSPLLLGLGIQSCWWAVPGRLQARTHGFCLEGLGVLQRAGRSLGCRSIALGSRFRKTPSANESGVGLEKTRRRHDTGIGQHVAVEGVSGGASRTGCLKVPEIADDTGIGAQGPRCLPAARGSCAGAPARNTSWIFSAARSKQRHGWSRRGRRGHQEKVVVVRTRPGGGAGQKRCRDPGDRAVGTRRKRRARILVESEAVPARFSTGANTDVGEVQPGAAWRVEVGRPHWGRLRAAWPGVLKDAGCGQGRHRG